jgi:hypothetical protein
MNIQNADWTTQKGIEEVSNFYLITKARLREKSYGSKNEHITIMMYNYIIEASFALLAVDSTCAIQGGSYYAHDTFPVGSVFLRHSYLF